MFHLMRGKPFFFLSEMVIWHIFRRRHTLLASCHRSLLRQKDMEEQVNQIVERLVIPKEWYELILAYYLNDKGMSEFELEG
jgi:hypothetical protein